MLGIVLCLLVYIALGADYCWLRSPFDNRELYIGGDGLISHTKYSDGHDSPEESYGRVPCLLV